MNHSMPIYLYQEFLGDPDLHDGNPRDTEDSNVVANYWLNGHASYAFEDIPDARCLRLVAERLIVRRILGIEKLDAAYEDKVGDVRVFGPESPLYSELAASGVFVAMAFVPLTPMDDRGNPCLARLYCVDGLTGVYTLPLEGMEEPELRGYSWFLEGVPLDDRNRGIVGRSWLLAARLLIEVVRKHDVKTARNLATHYIVTGNVENDIIGKVEIKRKIELARQFENFKWIIPKENDMEIPKRKIEKPATLDEAYRLIESMQSIATRSFFNALHKADIDEAKVQYAQMGADIYALEENTDLSVLEVVAHEIEKCEKDTSLPEDKREEKIIVLREIMLWLKQENADCAMMFYLLAQSGNESALASCTSNFPINAVDENGLTAVDWAIGTQNFVIAEQLRAVGGKINMRWGANRWVLSSYNKLFWDPCLNPELDENIPEDRALLSKLKLTETDRRIITEAIKSGLRSNVIISGKTRISRGGIGTLTTTPFVLSLYRGEVDLVEEWIRSGIDNSTWICAMECNDRGVSVVGECLCDGMPSATAIRIVERLVKNVRKRGGFSVQERDGTIRQMEFNNRDDEQLLSKYETILRVLMDHGFERDRPGEFYNDDDVD